jgi:hypothetical protein
MSPEYQPAGSGAAKAVNSCQPINPNNNNQREPVGHPRFSTGCIKRSFAIWQDAREKAFELKALNRCKTKPATGLSERPAFTEAPIRRKSI